MRGSKPNSGRASESIGSIFCWDWGGGGGRVGTSRRITGYKRVEGSISEYVAGHAQGMLCLDTTVNRNITVSKQFTEEIS
jgi:hypothetical protein